MPGRRRSTSERAVSAAKIAGAGAAGVAAVFAISPMAPAGAGTAKGADHTTAPVGNGTAKAATPTVATPKAAPKVAPIYGFQKYRVGVQLKSGAYAPIPAAPDTLTGDTTLTVVETGPNALGPEQPGTTSVTCTTSDATQDPNSTTTYCTQPQSELAARRARFSAVAPRLTQRPTPPGAPPTELFTAAPGDTVTITQKTVRPNLVIDSSTVTLEPCIADTEIIAGLGLCLSDPANPGSSPLKATDEIFDDNGLPPAATDDSTTAPYNGATTVDVLANDDTKSAPVTGLSVDAQPGHATAKVVSTSSGRQIRYTPAEGFVGTDTFDYTVQTANGSATATVTVTVAAPAPVAKDDTARTMRDEPVVVDVTRNDDTAGQSVTGLQIATGPQHGTARVVSTTSGRQVRYEPEQDFLGTDTFRYTVRTAGGSSTATVTVTVVAPPPDAVDDSASTTSGHSVSVPVTRNDSANGGGDLTVSSVGNPGHGSVRIDGENVVYTAGKDFVGTDTFTYTVRTSAGTDTATVTVTVSTSGVLANTGVDSAGLLGLAGGLLVAGAAGTIAGRRRRGRDAQA